MAALIKKIYEAKQSNAKEITLYGTGQPLRQFMNAKDFAQLIKQMIDKDITLPQPYNTTISLKLQVLLSNLLIKNPIYRISVKIL